MGINDDSYGTSTTSQTTVGGKSSTTNNNSSRTRRLATDHNIGLPDDTGTLASESEVKNKISGLLNKSNVSNKDLITIISQILSLLMDQKTQIQEILQEIRSTQREKIDELKTEVSDLRAYVDSLTIPKSMNPSAQTCTDSSNNEFDVITELQDRSSRAKNIIMFNVEESKSSDVSTRIEHDKHCLVDIFSQLELNEPSDLKVSRLGGLSAKKPRPLKIIFSDTSVVTECLRRKNKLNGTDVRISADYTPMQRKQYKKLSEEVKLRRANGESNITIRYRNGSPYIATSNNQEMSQVKSAKNDLVTDLAN